jgi:uncharacterized protein with PQ loop repeat|tara:strand:+ start:321 stop:662 length:342 start_codon:yes stop_codon:yes gene_type:complete
MATNHPGLHHMDKRKRQGKKLEPFPHPKKWMRFLDNFIYVVAIIIPLMTIPQILTIWINQSAQDVSLITWSAFLISAMVWLVYSVIHKDKPLIINSILWIILEMIIIIEIVIF